MTPVAPFTIARLLKAPRQLVYDVHTQAEHMAQWLSPAGFKTIHAAMDFRVGGSYLYGLDGPGGMQMWGKQSYLEIDPGHRIVLIQTFSDKDGGLTRHPMAASWPLEMLATSTFQDTDAGQTLLTISWLPHESDEAGNATFDSARPGMEQGFGGTFLQLEAYLASLQT